MKPSSDLAALAAAIHLDTYEDHPTPCTCLWWERDVAEAQRLVTELARQGFHIAPDVSLPESTKRGREGSLDLTDFTEQVLALFLTGPLDTWALNTLYAQRSDGLPSLYPPRSFDTPRKRLSELERAGLVRQVLDGDKQATREHHGVRYGVWEITDAGRAAVQTVAKDAA